MSFPMSDIQVWALSCKVRRTWEVNQWRRGRAGQVSPSKYWELDKSDAIRQGFATCLFLSEQSEDGLK